MPIWRALAFTLWGLSTPVDAAAADRISQAANKAAAGKQAAR